MTQPVYATPPVAVRPGVVPVPVYPAPIYPRPFGVYPVPSVYPYPVAGPTVMVLPPGYHRDFTPGYSPFGDLWDDINSIF